MKKNFLSASKMGKIVAQLLGKNDLPVNRDGKVTLTPEERDTVVNTYGERFASMLEATAFDDESSEASADLFNAAVDHVAETRIAPLNEQIRTLQDTINTLAAQPEDDPAPQAVAQGTAPTALRVNMKAAINRMASSYLSTGLMPEVSASTLDITELTEELGTYLSQGNNLDLLSELYHAFTTSKHLNWKRAVSEYKAVQSHITSVVQRFKPEWNAKGESKFTVLTVKNNRLKVNFPVVAAEVGESWLYHLYDEKKTPQEMPITRYIVQNVLMPSIVNDIELKMIAKGKYNEGLDTPEASMDGFETILVNARKSLDKGIRFFNTDVNLRTATDAQVVETIDDFVASIAPLYQGIKMPLFCSREIYMKYKRGYKAKWGAGSGTEKVQFGEDTIDFSNCHLVVLESMYGSPIIFSTPPENFVGLQYKNPPTFITDIQKQDYMLKYFCEFWLGVGFLIGEAVFAICPADYDPQASIASEGFDARDKWIVTSEDTQDDLSEEGA